MVSQKVTINNPQGLHIRPAGVKNKSVNRICNLSKKNKNQAD